MEIQVTPKTRKALTILRKHGQLSATRFAELNWPKSEYWQKSYKCGRKGNAAVRGRGMWLAAGSYLAKLAKLKYVNREYTYDGQRAFTITAIALTELDMDGRLIE
jgi:hypothetical protein